MHVRRRRAIRWCLQDDRGRGHYGNGAHWRQGYRLDRDWHNFDWRHSHRGIRMLIRGCAYQNPDEIDDGVGYPHVPVRMGIRVFAMAVGPTVPPVAAMSVVSAGLFEQRAQPLEARQT